MSMSCVEGHAAALEHQRYVGELIAIASPAQKAIAINYGQGFVALADCRRSLLRLLGAKAPRHPIYNP